MLHFRNDSVHSWRINGTRGLFAEERQHVCCVRACQRCVYSEIRRRRLIGRRAATLKPMRTHGCTITCIVHSQPGFGGFSINFLLLKLQCAAQRTWFRCWNGRKQNQLCWVGFSVADWGTTVLLFSHRCRFRMFTIATQSIFSNVHSMPNRTCKLFDNISIIQIINSNRPDKR